MATIGNRGTKVKLRVRQGATLGPFTATLTDATGAPVLLYDVEVRGAIRKSFTDETVYLLTCAVEDADAGKVSFQMPADITATIPCGEFTYSDESQYIWDTEVEFLTTGRVIPVTYGPVEVAGEVTK